MRTSLLLLVALGLMSCGEPLTQIVLKVNSDIPTTSIGPVLITVRGPTGILGVEYTADFSRSDGPTGFPITLGLVLQDEAVGQAVSVEVVASSVDGFDRVAVSAETNFVYGSTRELELRLESVCISIACDIGETCQGGVCVTNQIDGETLPEFTE